MRKAKDALQVPSNASTSIDNSMSQPAHWPIKNNSLRPLTKQPRNVFAAIQLNYCIYYIIHASSRASGPRSFTQYTIHHNTVPTTIQYPPHHYSKSLPAHLVPSITRISILHACFWKSSMRHAVRGRGRSGAETGMRVLKRGGTPQSSSRFGAMGREIFLFYFLFFFSFL